MKSQPGLCSQDMLRARRRRWFVTLVALMGLGLATPLTGCDETDASAGDSTLLEENPGGCPRQPVAPAATLESLASPGPYGFATRDFTFVDTSRPTPPNRDYPGAPERTLRTRVYYPVCGPRKGSPPPAERVPVASGGPFPLVAYAHGFSSVGDNARYFGEHLASHGYIVAAPLFPLTQRNSPGGPTIVDEPQQPADLAFVLDQVARLGGEDADLAAAVDAERRGVMGLSAGGLTVLIAAYHPLLRIEGIQAAVAQAPVSCFFGPAFYARSLPTLIISGTADELVPPVGPEKAFSLAPPPATLLELEGGTHTGFMNREVPFVTNTDTPECEQLLSFNPMSGDAAFNEALTRGVGPGVIDPTGCTPLCATRFTQTMSATRQTELSRAATLAHFEAELKGRQDAGEFLRQQLAEQAPDTRVRTRP